MKIKSLYLNQYRNIEELKIQFSDGLNIFIGPNGQGKTNILESIYVIINGQSFRYGQNETLIRFNEERSYLLSELTVKDLEYKIKLLVEKSKKKYSVNDKTFTHKNSQLMSAILFSPESLNIIKSSADERRQLIDEAVKQLVPHGVDILNDFKKALRSRNKILKDMADQKISNSYGLQHLEALNPLFLKSATELTSQRIKVLLEIKNLVTEILQSIETKNTVQFDFNYIISDEKITTFEPVVIYQKLQKRMAELSLSEAHFGSSLVGPHKHDIAFLYNGNDSRFFCSQGQQRSIILAFKMAQIVYHYRVNGFYPVLLLDDVLSELDQTKQEALINYLNTIKTQTFLTTTNVEVLEKLNSDKKLKFFIQEGKIIDTV